MHHIDSTYLNILKTGLSPARARNRLEIDWKRIETASWFSKWLNLQLGKFMQERQCSLPLLALHTCICSRIESDDAPLQSFRLIKKHQSFLPGRSTCSDHGIVAHDGGLPEWISFFIDAVCHEQRGNVVPCPKGKIHTVSKNIQKIPKESTSRLSQCVKTTSRLSQIVFAFSLSMPFCHGSSSLFEAREEVGLSAPTVGLCGAEINRNLCGKDSVILDLYDLFVGVSMGFLKQGSPKLLVYNGKIPLEWMI